MVNRTEMLYKEHGVRLRYLRQELRLTMDVVSKDTGISRSYLSDFERGFRMPTSKYLTYLHEHHKINLNYIFGSEGRMFRSGSAKIPDFGMMQGEVDNLLRLMGDVPTALFAVLGFGAEFNMKNKELIEKIRKEKETTGTGDTV